MKKHFILYCAVSLFATTAFLPGWAQAATGVGTGGDTGLVQGMTALEALGFVTGGVSQHRQWPPSQRERGY